MSDHSVEPHPNGSEESGKYLTAKQWAWMKRWMQPKHKRLRDDNLCLENRDMHEMIQHSSMCNQGPEPGGLRALSGLKNGAKSRSIGEKKGRSNLLSFPIFNIHKKGGSDTEQVPGTQIGQCSQFDVATTGTLKPHSTYVFGHQLQGTGNASRGSKLLPKETPSNRELELRAHDSIDGGCMPSVKSSQRKLLGMPISYPYGIIYRKENVTSFASTSKEHIFHRSSYHDSKTDAKRLASSVDVREGIHLGPPMYAEKTRHICITEKMLIGVSNEGKVFKESMLSAKFNGNVSGFLKLYSASGQDCHGVKLQLLDCSTNSEPIGRGSEKNQKDEGIRIIGRLNTIDALPDETSAETGLGVSRSDKAALLCQSTPSSQGQSANTGLPDMNEDEIAQAPDRSADKEALSASKTESLDMECLFSNNHYRPSTSKPIFTEVIQPRAELGSRWVKRLKLSSSVTKYAAVGTKSSTIEEPSSYEKQRKLSSNLFNHSIGPSASDTHTRKTSEGSKKIIVERSSFTYYTKDDIKALLSHPWIRRWRHDQIISSRKQPNPTEPSETPKASYDQFEKKTFPSIAAMALMGKAMNGLRPCEFTKKGSFIVWNTNNLPSD